MVTSLKIALAQINPKVGDIASNAELIKATHADAAKTGADLVVFSELVLSGYPPEDLVYRPAFLDAVENATNELAQITADNGPGILIGAPWRDFSSSRKKKNGKLEVYNAGLLLDAGKIAGVRFKYNLPNYGVFDEHRVFKSGPLPGPLMFRGVRLGVMVCEDMWSEDVAETLVESGAELLIVLNGSPFELDKLDVRLDHAVARVSETRLPLIYVNQIGGQDDLVFDGGSFVLNADRALAVQMPSWQENLAITNWQRVGDNWVCDDLDLNPALDRMENVYRALMLGLADYVRKNNFPGVVIGLSGGVDSALTAAVAVDALGADKVRCVMMPSPYTSTESLEDANGAAQLLGARLDTVNIGPVMQAYDALLEPLFVKMQSDTTEENIQARARGITLMALSNKFGHMVLSTGNKSEVSVGYSTLYGDLCGGFSVLKDVYKTTVFDLSRWRNAQRPMGAMGPNGPVMPTRIITKPPSAELKPNQTDQDTLPPYDVLDGILKGLIEGEMGVHSLAAQGFKEAVVRRIYRMLKIAEYKRRQAPPGVKITHIAFGRDYRYPITNGFDDSVEPSI
ncbi:MAG: NAD+ synthase [Candidatus Marinimicrobia bacterium]|nr:NAD+ synthase [Candidatus Neomarinimicrobiota bacterium]